MESAKRDPGRTPDSAEGGHEVAGSPTLNLKVLQAGQETLVSLGGELDLSSAPALRELLAGTFEDDRQRRIVLDLTDLIYLDSTGLSIFVTAHKRAAATGMEFCLANPNPSIGQLFKITALDHFFTILDSAGSIVATTAGDASDGPGSAEPR
ncbi:MAG TPA: STAS domain-containing protein [Acidimicrobiales bacterium]